MGNGGKGKGDGKGHNRGEAMNVDGLNGVPTTQPTCNKCGKKGHLAKQCQQKTNTPTAPTNVCGFCKKPGHKAEDCFKNPQSSKYRVAPQVKVTNPNGETKNVGTIGTTKVNQNQPKGSQQQHTGYIPQQYIPAYQGPQLWCPSCNSNEHAGDSCPLSRVHLSHSKMVCINCGLRGHTEADCRHPDPVNCTICHKTGHKAESCRSDKSKMCKDGSLLGKKDMRFRWNDTNIFQIKKTIAQQKQLFLENEIAELQHQELYGGPVDMVDAGAIEQEYQNVADESLLQWRGQTEFLPIPLLHGKAMPSSTQSRSSRVSKPHSTSRLTSSGSSSASTVATAGSGINTGIANKVQNWVNNNLPPPLQNNPFTDQAPSTMSAIQHPNPFQCPLDAVSATALAARMVAENETAVQKAVRAQITKSYRSYRTQNYNQRIRQLATTLAERQVLSDRKLTEVHMAMAAGVNFWRDPRAMDALVHRRQALCDKCGHEGVIHDGRMRAIPVENAWVEGGKNVLEIEDFMDWGLFVVFHCSCCNDGYDWKQRPSFTMDVEQVPGSASASVFVNSSGSSRPGSSGSL